MNTLGMVMLTAPAVVAVGYAIFRVYQDDRATGLLIAAMVATMCVGAAILALYP